MSTTTTTDTAAWPLYLFKSARQHLDDGDQHAAIAVMEIRSQWKGSEKAWALIRAGWRIEWPEHDGPIFSWAWRRPARRAGRPGRWFGSTERAFNAMRKEAQS